MIAQANITSIVVGKDDALATNTEAKSDLIAGQIGVYLVGTDVGKTTALTAGQRFQVVYKRVDGALIESPVINYSDIVAKNATLTAAAVNASKAVGFNGTTGSIDVANNEDYVLHYNWNDNSKTFGRGKPVKFLAYRSDSNATQVEIAEGLAANAAANNSKEVYPIIKVKAVINNAGAVITGTGNITANYGSKYVTAATDADAVLAVGDYLRLGTAAGAAVTDDAYRVVSIDTTNDIIELDRPFQGATAVYTEANCDYIAAVTAATADAGIILTAQDMPFEPGIKKYSPVYFDFWKIGEGFGSTTITNPLTIANKGKGTYKEVAEVEWFLRGNRGETWRQGNYPKNITLDATEGKTYDTIVVEYKDKNARTLDRDVESFGAILIATEDESASTVHTQLKTVLGIS